MSLPSSPAALRNREPIAEVLAQLLPDRGQVLEIASGTGEHVVFFAERFPQLTWQPSDGDTGAVALVSERLKVEARTNVGAPLHLDVCATPWPVTRADAIFNANMIHISPWESTLGLLKGAGLLLGPAAPLILYGPYKRNGVHTSPSNEGFDQNLRSRDPSWGVRDLEEVESEAQSQGFELVHIEQMPANNLTVCFRKREA